MIKISNSLAEILGEKGVKITYSDKIDYGKIYNMIYIVSFILGAEVVHRRDSIVIF